MESENCLAQSDNVYCSGDTLASVSHVPKQNTDEDIILERTAYVCLLYFKNYNPDKSLIVEMRYMLTGRTLYHKETLSRAPHFQLLQWIQSHSALVFRRATLCLHVKL